MSASSQRLARPALLGRFGPGWARSTAGLGGAPFGHVVAVCGGGVGGHRRLGVADAAARQQLQPAVQHDVGREGQQVAEHNLQLLPHLQGVGRAAARQGARSSTKGTRPGRGAGLEGSGGPAAQRSPAHCARRSGHHCQPVRSSVGRCLGGRRRRPPQSSSWGPGCRAWRQWGRPPSW